MNSRNNGYPRRLIRHLVESGQRSRQRALVQDAEPLRRTGEGDIEFGGAALALREDALRLHNQDRVELQALRFRRRDRARNSRRTDHQIDGVRRQAL